jgi:cyclase
MDDYDSGLTRLAPDTYAYLRPPGTWGWSNSGLIVGGDRAVLVDTAYTRALTSQMLEEIADRVPGARIDHCVLTHGNGDHTFGAELLDGIEIVAGRACAESMHEEISPEAMVFLMEHGPQPLRDYMVRHFGHFDFTGASLPSPTTTFEGRHTLEVGERRIELIEVGPAHSAGDVAVYVPDAALLFAGDIVFAGDTPIAWASARGMIDACDTLAATGATRIVPGHGPVVEAAYLQRVRDYFGHVLEHAERFAAQGLAYHEAAARTPLEGFADWRLPERLVLSMAAAYRDLGYPVTDEAVAVISHAARFAGVRADAAA